MSANDRQEGGDHYQQMKIQVWDVVDQWPLEQRIGFYRGNSLKYNLRMGSKDNPEQEAAKSEHYMAKLREVLREQATTPAPCDDRR